MADLGAIGVAASPSYGGASSPAGGGGDISAALGAVVSLASEMVANDGESTALPPIIVWTPLPILDPIAIINANIGTIDANIVAIRLKTDTLGGAGAITWTYTVTDSGTDLPIADVDVWVTTDISGGNIIASAKTNAAGVATFYLDAGTVYIWRQKSGYSFTNPDTEVVV